MEADAPASLLRRGAPADEFAGPFRLAAREIAAFLSGRLVARRGRDLTFEITVHAALDWEPGRATGVSVLWADGTVVEAEIVTECTTAPGHVERGMSVRLCVRLVEDGPSAPPARVTVTAPATRLAILVT